MDQATGDLHRTVRDVRADINHNTTRTIHVSSALVTKHDLDLLKEDSVNTPMTGRFLEPYGRVIWVDQGICHDEVHHPFSAKFLKLLKWAEANDYNWIWIDDEEIGLDHLP